MQTRLKGDKDRSREANGKGIMGIRVGGKGAWSRVASLYKLHPWRLTNSIRDVLNTMGSDAITKQGRQDRDQRRCRGEEKSVRVQAGEPRPLWDNSPPTWTRPLSLQSMSSYFYHLWLSCMLFNLICIVSYSIDFPKLYPPPRLVFAKLLCVITCCLGRSLLKAAWSSCAWTGHIGLVSLWRDIQLIPLFFAVINNMLWAFSHGPPCMRLFSGSGSQTILELHGGLNKTDFWAPCPGFVNNRAMDGSKNLHF